MEFDLLLGQVHSLKAKRSVVRPLIAEIRRKFEVSVAETGHQDLHRRAGLGVGLVASDASQVMQLLDRIERTVADHPEFELLSTRRGLHSSTDE